MGEKCSDKFRLRIRLPRNSRDLLHAANLRHGTDGFTSPPKEGVLRIFFPLKIRRLRPGLNPRTWVPKASTLPLDHRSRFTFDILVKLTEIPGICRGVDVVFALLGRNAAYFGVWLSTFRDNLSVPPSRVNNWMKFDSLTLGVGPVRLSGNVTDCHFTARNIREELRT